MRNRYMRRRATGDSFAGLRNMAAQVMSEYVRRRDADEKGIVQCVTCPSRGHWKDFDAGHFLKGRSFSTANLLDERAQHPQCLHCNRGLDGRPKEYEAYMLRRYGLDVVEELKVQRWQSDKKMTSADLQEIIIATRAKIVALASKSSEPHYTDNTPF